MFAVAKKMAKASQEVEQQTSTWSTIFPAEQRTLQDSALFVKKLLTVGVSSITYLRNLFPEQAYEDYCLDGLNLKVLSDESPCQPAKTLFSLLQSSFDAIDRRYLRELTFVIYEDPAHPEIVLENYKYKLKYFNGGDPEIEFSSSTARNIVMKCDIRKTTRKMLRNIFLLTQSLSPLPKKVFLGIELAYFNEVTPAEYEPEGFITTATYDSQHDDDCINFAAGAVRTLFHSVKVRVSVIKSRWDGEDKSAGEELQEREEQKSLDHLPEEIVRKIGNGCTLRKSDTSGTSSSELNLFTDEGNKDISCPLATNLKSSMDLDSPSNVNEDNVTDATENVEDILQTPPSGSSYRIPEISTHKAFDVPTSFASTTYSNVRTPTGQACTTPASTASIRSVIVPSPCVPDPDFTVRCPCGVNLDDGLMILCSECGNWQHGACFKILEEEAAPSQHICELCSRPSIPCTDPSLTLEKDIAMTCLYRRILPFLKDFNRSVTVSCVSQRLGIDISMGQKIYSRLSSEKILKKSSIAGGRQVNKECLSTIAFPGYFMKVMGKDKIFPGTHKSSPSAKERVNITRNDITDDTEATTDHDVTTLQSTLRNLSNMKDLSEFGESQDVNVGTQFVQIESPGPNYREKIVSTPKIAVTLEKSMYETEMEKTAHAPSFSRKRSRRLLSRAAKRNHTFLNSD